MDSLRNRYRIAIIIVILIMGFGISAIYFLSISNVEQIYKEYAREAVIDTKKTFLKDTVNNVIIDIDRKNEAIALHYYQRIKETNLALENYYHASPGLFLSLCSAYIKNQDNLLDVFVTEIDSGTLVYQNRIAVDSDTVASLNEADYQEKYSSYTLQKYGNYNVFLGIEKKIIHDLVKAEIHDEIHRMRFSNDSYVWVNEVINYDGGDNYAIRRIHPNLKNTEGDYLSTNIQDAKGAFPYLTELEGIKKEGEILQYYYFQKNNSEKISKKVSYAKLYKDYDWIIATGVHLDDVEAYVEHTSRRSEATIQKMLLGMAGLVLLLLFLSFLIVNWVEKWYFRNSNLLISDELYKDPLTGAFNRRAAENRLRSAFKQYKSTNESITAILIDIDDFKQVNDQYGHDRGDEVLVKVTSCINEHIRSTDLLCRWGGEEFLLICSGLKPHDVKPFTNKLIHSVAALKYEFITDLKPITVSMGASVFIKDDKDYAACIKRADTALYKAKACGKNTAIME